MSKKIYINPGHSNTDPGAVGYETERALIVKVSNYMNEYLIANYECETRMNPGTMDRLSIVCDDANKWAPDLFVSIHFNAAGGDGFECYVYNENRVPLGAIFAEHVKAIGQNLRLPDVVGMPFGVKLRPNLYVLKYTNMPAILLEGAFVDNNKDIQDWNDDSELKTMGIAYAKAAAEYLKLSKKVVEDKPYTLTQFIKDVQRACGAKVDGIAGPETLFKTVTVSANFNRRHAVVKPIQKRLYELGYIEVGDADGIAGPMFSSAINRFQKENGYTGNGVVSARNKTWKKLLGMA